MFNRLPQIPEHSFILFGPRGSGKSTWLKKNITKDFLLFDLLDLKTQRILVRHPEKLAEMIADRPKKTKWIIIDEIQKIPTLLDSVHSLMESTDLKFALSGSSARKLRRGAANLLAGRAFEMRMYPLTSFEMGRRFRLQEALEWGTLPKTISLRKDEDRGEFLQTYAHLYIKEEIKEEQVVRKLDPFMDFLAVAAQMDGKIVNFSKIAKDVGVDTSTVISYFKILEDTFIGSYLPAYHASVRKRQRQNPKFYFFDSGVRRALEGTLGEPVPPGRIEHGRLFEGFVMNEVMRLNIYTKKRYGMSFLNADEDAEIDLILEKGRRPRFIAEIKSSDRVETEHVKPLLRFQKDFPEAKAVCLSNDPRERVECGIIFVHWKRGLELFFGEIQKVG